MTGIDSDKAILDRLLALQESASLDAEAADICQHLCDRLGGPVRTVILGLPGSGKSELLNMVAGQRVIPALSDLPPVSMTWGDSQSTIITNTDGTSDTQDGLGFEEVLRDDTELVALQAPLDSLRRISLLEAAPDRATNDIAAMVDWAVSRADIILWCSQEFGAQERDLWASVPDAVKDHSFLVLTKADELSANGQLTNRLTELQDIAAEEFHSLIPVATLQAVDAICAEPQADQDTFKASGGLALVSAIQRQAKLGRRADIDSALLFLSRHEVETDEQDGPDTATNPEPAHQNITTLHDSDQTSDPVAPALTYLQASAERIAQSLSGVDADLSGEILQQCVDISDHLIGIFASADLSKPGQQALSDDFMDAADMLLLMQLENENSAAADAITLLLQLRRELETSLAA